MLCSHVHVLLFTHYYPHHFPHRFYLSLQQKIETLQTHVKQLNNHISKQASGRSLEEGGGEVRGLDDDDYTSGGGGGTANLMEASTSFVWISCMLLCCFLCSSWYWPPCVIAGWNDGWTSKAIRFDAAEGVEGKATIVTHNKLFAV
jgi:hypothetical protein